MFWNCFRFLSYNRSTRSLIAATRARLAWASQGNLPFFARRPVVEARTTNCKWALTDTAVLISELTRSVSFYIFFSTELLMFLECWQTGKEFRLSWHSFVRVENRLSINKKCRPSESWIFHSGVVRASAWRSRGREFESQTIRFLYQSFYFFFISFSFPFYLSRFWVKQCANIYRKYDNTGSTVVLYCCCHSDSASVLLYFTCRFTFIFAHTPHMVRAK